MLNKRFAALIAVAILVSVLAPLVARLVYPMPSPGPVTEESSYSTSQQEHEIQLAESNRSSLVEGTHMAATFAVVLVGLGILIVRLGQWLTAHSSLTTVERDEPSRRLDPQSNDSSASDVAHSTAQQMGRAFGVGERAFKSLRGSFNQGRSQTNGQPEPPKDS